MCFLTLLDGHRNSDAFELTTHVIDPGFVLLSTRKNSLSLRPKAITHEGKRDLDSLGNDAAYEDPLYRLIIITVLTGSSFLRMQLSALDSLKSLGDIFP